MSTGTTRRATIGAAAGILAGAAAPAAGAHPDAALLAACAYLAQLTALRVRLDLDGADLTEADADAACGAWWDALRAVTRMPATTLGGMRAKAAAAAGAFRQAIGVERGLSWHEQASPLELLAVAALDDAAGVRT